MTSEPCYCDDTNDAVSAPAAPGPVAVPISSGQRRLLFFEQFQPGSPMCNLPVAARIEGPLEATTLEQAVNEVIRRHETLRTRIDYRDGRPVQVIAPSSSISLDVADLEPLPETARESEKQRLMAEEAKRPFDLTKLPLLRAKLLRLSAENHIFLFTIHQMMSDGLSITVFFREVAVCYEALSNGRRVELPPPRTQYADFSVWQWERSKTLGKEMAWWKRHLDGKLPVLELPTLRPRPSIQTFRGAVESYALPHGLREELRGLSQKAGTTLYMTLLAAFQALLHRYTAQEDLLVGSTISGRDLIEIEEGIGLFLNTVVLRGDMSGNPTFLELLERARRMIVDALANGTVPFAQVVEEVKPERSLSHPPLFQVMFALETDPLESVAWPGVKLTSMATHNGTSKYDLTLSIIESLEGLTARVEYNQSLFSSSWIERMLAHFETMLKGILQNPAARLSELPLLTEGERNQLLVEWNRTESDFQLDSTISELIEAQVERTPEAAALTFGDQTRSYRELDGRANQTARYLQKIGVRPGDLVGICLERSGSMIASLLGILKTGAAYLPLDPSYPKERLAFMIEDSHARVVVTERRCLDLLPRNGLECVCLDTQEQAIAKESRSRPDKAAHPESRAYVIYTSGSTGKPKGVQIQHRAVVNFLQSMRREPGIKPEDSLLAVTTLSFDIAGLEIYLPLTLGARVVLANRDLVSDGPQLAAKIAEERITVMQATPATWRLLLHSNWSGSASLRIFCGGEPMSRELAAQLLERCAELWNLYGPTETTIWSAAVKIERGNEPVVIGRPIANTQFYILDQYGQPVPIGAAGELFIGGAGLSPGYMGRPELTAERFVRNRFAAGKMYRTGDRARWRPDGNVELLGRLDHQVKIRGFRIELGEIEAVLRKFTSVREAVVVAREWATGDARLIAYLTSYSLTTVSLNELRQFLREKLPAYMVPSAFVLLEKLPLTPNGKVDRAALPMPENHQARAEVEVSPPRPGLEQQLAALWTEVLGIGRPGADDNFFDRGGHSLAVVQVQTRLREELGHNLPVIKFFEYPTIRSLAGYLNDENNESAFVQTVNERARKQRAAASARPRPHRAISNL